MIGSPKITVLMSCYNAADYLGEAIDSVLYQTFKDFEFILIDDGSTDNTLNIIKRYAQSDGRIIIVEKDNSGLADSLNKGIKIAKGEWIARLDADDIAFPKRLEKQLNYVKDKQDYVLIGSGCITIDKSGKKIKDYKYPSESRNIINWLVKGKSSFPHSSAFYLTSVVRRLGGYRPRITYAEDIDLWLRLSTIGKIGCIEEPLIKLRKHDGSITAREKKCAVSAYAAVVSFLLARDRISDPVEQDEDQYRFFMNWIEKHLLQNGYFERQKARDALLAIWRSNNQYSLFNTMLCFWKEPVLLWHGINLIKERLVGSSLSINMAEEWRRLFYNNL